MLEALYSRMEELNGELEREQDDEETSTQYQAEKKKYSTLYNSLMKYCNQSLIIGFNSQNYDVLLIRKYLVGSLTKSLPLL